MASLVAQTVKNLPTMQETWVQSLGGEDPLEEEMAVHSSILAWRLLWTEEPGGLQSVGSHRESDTTERLTLFTPTYMFQLLSWAPDPHWCNPPSSNGGHFLSGNGHSKHLVLSKGLTDSWP